MLNKSKDAVWIFKFTCHTIVRFILGADRPAKHYGQGIVQTTNLLRKNKVAKAIVVRKSSGGNPRAGSNPVGDNILIEKGLI
jgi:hypothetical protein